MLDSIATAVAAAMTLAGVAATATAVFRIKTRDDTITSQKLYIEALSNERDAANRRAQTAEARLEVLTDDFAHTVGAAVARAVREELRRE